MSTVTFQDQITSQEVTLHYQTFGDVTKPALIFSNSLGTNLGMWKKQFNHFKQHYFIVCYDTRGHGASSTPQGPYCLDQLGHDVIQLLDHLNISKASFCGISMGGLTGQWLAIHFPDRFNAVIIANTAAKIGQAQAWQDRAKLVREQGLQPIAETAASRWFTEEFIQQHSFTVASLSSDLAAGSANGYANCCEALAQADLREKLSQINIPVLVIAGQHDPVTTVSDGKWMQQQIADAQLVEINASHISNVEQPEQFNRYIEHFLGVKI